MANEFDTKVIQEFAREISGRLAEAAVIARTADDFAQRGLGERAFRSLLQLEPLIHEASILLNATAVVRRRDLEHECDLD